MLTRAIACLNCGNAGEIEVQGLISNEEPSRIFRHRGHNPFSGHMHYQCPACEIVLLVDPLTVLGQDGISVLCHDFLPARAEARRAELLPPLESLLHKMFQSQGTGYC